jgi:uncharacterized protein YdhG (YjbR/CyaY superfamily)
VTVDEYLAKLPEEQRAVLQRVRETVRAVFPEHEERIRYGMPAVMLNDRNALYFAAWKKHVGLYPVPPLGGRLEGEVAPFRSGQDSVRFPYAPGVPYDLIGRVAQALRDA